MLEILHRKGPGITDSVYTSTDKRGLEDTYGNLE